MQKGSDFNGSREKYSKKKKKKNYLDEEGSVGEDLRDIDIQGAWSAMYSMSLSPSLLALLLISVAFGAADGFGISEIKIIFKNRL